MARLGSRKGQNAIAQTGRVQPAGQALAEHAFAPGTRALAGHDQHQSRAPFVGRRDEGRDFTRAAFIDMAMKIEFGVDGKLAATQTLAKAPVKGIDSTGGKLGPRR